MDQFQHLHNLNIHSSCRACLENLNDMHHNIFEIPDLQRKLTVCISLPVEPGDGLPTSLCEPCHTKIDDFYDFHQMCTLARQKFMDYINSEKKPSTMQLALDSDNLPTDIVTFKEEAKKEQEESSISNDECLEFDAAELANVKNQDDSSSQDEEESEDDHDQQVIKYHESDDDNSIIDNSQLNENEDNKPDEKKTKASSENVIVLGCKICKKTFKKEETFTAHMRVHAGLKPFPCQQCDKSYARRSRLKLHVDTKHEGVTAEKFPCTEPGCDRIMCSKQTLRKHIKDIHNSTGAKTTSQPYICEECGKVLTSLATLKNHRFLHTGQQPPHECPQCFKRYITKNKLKEHMNRHAGIRNFVCPHCGAKKSTRTELKTHINYHTKEKTYPCQFCGTVFNSIGNYSRHKRIVHEGIKDYPCSYCDKSFGKAETRKHHEMTHTGERPHECNICHKKFIQPVALKKHKKIHLKAIAGQPDWCLFVYKQVACKVNKMERFRDIQNYDIHSSCRTCLESTKEIKYSIFAISDLQKKITVCTSLPAEPDDGYPTNLCEPCYIKIEDFFNFQQMCISTRKRYQMFIDSEKKLYKTELGDDANDLSTDLIQFTEPKEEKEDSYECSEFPEDDISNAKRQDDSSSDNDRDESDDDEPIVKYRVSNKDISSKDRKVNENAKTSEEIKSFSSKINLECKICKKIFMNSDTFEEHMRTHEGLKPFACEQCDKSYARPGRLKVHIRVKHEGKPFSCPEPGCNKTLCTKQTLDKHIAELHSETNVNNGIKTKQLYICEECGKVLKGLSTLKNHMFLHSGQPRPHACPQCHKRYMTRCKLKDHMNRHAGIKNFVCPHCGAKKSSRSELKNHINYHTKEKTYPCQICDMVFNNIVNYSRHRRVVHEGIKNFKCSYCEKSFGKSETRKHHEMTHTGERPHECKICHKKFIQIVSLKKHQKVHLNAEGNNL
ncbi:zinc finger protein 665 [Eupeodes corollae]|uniref:zinc finger protein 665 n=1 Tax=Eupeodes corollae TaxID=290404 RepID=UPI00248F8A60|nr:zinc finger protein 665 [Eupeodes corollae]